MTQTLSLDEIAVRGDAIFEARIKPLVTNENPDDFLAIDIITGDYEIDKDALQVRKQLRLRHPDATIFMRRVGDEAAYYVGGGYQS